jgi:hypothetical protein
VASATATASAGRPLHLSLAIRHSCDDPTRVAVPGRKERFALLGRKNFTKEEIDHCRTEIDRQMKAYKDLAGAAAAASAAKGVDAALGAFEPLFFNNLALALDRYFVHRLRSVTGKDGTPLNELELLADSLMNNNGVLQGNNVVKFVPDESVVKLQIGDPIRLTADQFERLSSGVLAELEQKYL